MPSALGLSSYRWNNNIKSALLLLALPLLLLGLLGGFFGLAGLLYVQPDGTVHPDVLQTLGLNVSGLTPWQMAVAGVWDYWPIMMGAALVWTLLGYLFNDAMIRAATGARPVERRDASRLYNLLENLCISRGLKTPKLYIIDTGGLNAYASGMDEGSYSVTVTRGLLERLDDAEMEAVLAHELTHIMNRDVRLLVITIVFTGMLSFLAQMLWRSLRVASYGRNREREGGKGAFVLMLLASVMLALGYALALVLRFALSRRREYLADAGSVELTKNPEALIAALEKISGNPNVPNVPPEAQQMFIENPPSLFGLFDTHPPMADRIRVLRALGGLPPQGESIIPKAG
ncbi:MAG: M48 family metallopeptidase [Alphaproteobacteria bacterium]|nr:M48 family metallopeptidase [Alphaproteobacteria bacterium]